MTPLPASALIVCPRPRCAEVNSSDALYCWRCGCRLVERHVTVLPERKST